MKIYVKIKREDLKPQLGDLGNRILYKLCEDYPDHKEPDVIVSKVWLIGRAYAAAIERRKKRDDINDDFYRKKVVSVFQKSKIDNKLKNIKKYKEINCENIKEILEVHKYLVNEIKKITGLEKRSLVSKYLHFHLPELFFIYDSRAISALKLISKPLNKNEYRSKIDNRSVDKEYAKFFYRAFNAKNNTERDFNEKISTREFDNALINIANKNLKKNK